MAKYPFRRALITGASAGIGEQFAHELGKARIPCVLVARREERLVDLAAKYPGCEVLTADLFSAGGIAKVVERLGANDDPVDLLVNNAGFGSSGPFASLGVEKATGQVDLNIRALIELSHAALTAFAARNGGYLLNVSSVASFQPGPGMAVYSATKAFVTSFTEAIHEECRKTNIRVSALCPGFVRTEFQEVADAVGAVDKVPGFLWLQADKVAAEGLAGVAKGRAIIVPGTQYKSLLVSGRLMPRALARRVAGGFVAD